MREEFIGLWSSATHSLLKTKHVRARVLDLDFGFLMDFFDFEAAAKLERHVLFETISITLVFTRVWGSTDRREGERRLENWLLWCEEEGRPMASAWPTYTARIDLDAEVARLPFVAYNASEAQLDRIVDAVEKACGERSKALG